jgi:hypothetical protein
MRRLTRIPPAPVGQPGPPARAAAFDPWRSLRSARGPLLLATGTAPHAQTKKLAFHCRKLDTEALSVNP